MSGAKLVAIRPRVLSTLQSIRVETKAAENHLKDWLAWYGLVVKRVCGWAGWEVLSPNPSRSGFPLCSAPPTLPLAQMFPVCISGQMHCGASAPGRWSVLSSLQAYPLRAGVSSPSAVGSGFLFVVRGEGWLGSGLVAMTGLWWVNISLA